MDIILKYFKELNQTQIEQFQALGKLYEEWNEKINVVSRKDIENLYERHVLHSLSIAKYLSFSDGTTILDVGTGGGFPGIPLAIMFPKCHFTLLDSIGKKIRVATEVANAIGLQNVLPMHQRVQENSNKYDFVVSRAVMKLDELVALSKKNISTAQSNALPNGIICLKGGEVEGEISKFKKYVDVVSLTDYYEEEFFVTKKVIYLPL